MEIIPLPDDATDEQMISYIKYLQKIIKDVEDQIKQEALIEKEGSRNEKIN
jgi:uncharacterized protein YktA (UPF0223 family)